MSQQIRILVVEDDPEMREALATVLSDQGYRVVTASSGEQAVEEAAAQEFELIVTDIRMDGMNGLQTLEKARQLLPEVGSLVVTGYANEEETRRATTQELGGFLRKPFRMRDLLQMVERIVGESQRQQARRDEREILVDSIVALLEGIVASHDHGRLGPKGMLRATAELGSSLARTLGCPEMALETGLAASLQQLREAGLWDPPEEFLKGSRHMPTLQGFLQGNSGDSRAAAALRLAAKAQAGRAPEEPAPWSELALDPEIDPKLEEAYSSSLRPDPQAPAHPNRGLLQLARALEESGQGGAARLAYQKVLEQSASLEAALGLARLRPTPESLEVCQRLARAQGPATAARIQLECGLIWLRAGRKEEARPFFEHEGPTHPPLSQLFALARHGSGGPLESDWPVLLDPRHSDNLAQNLDWLLPALLEADLARSLPPLMGRFPREFGLWLLEDSRSESWNRICEQMEKASFVPEDVVGALSSSPVLRHQKLAQSLEQGPGEGLLRVHSFGVFEAFLGSRRISDTHWKTQKSRYIFAFLVAQGARRVHEEVVLETFWPEATFKANRSLNTALSTIRGALGSSRSVLREMEFISINAELPRWSDLQEFETSLKLMRDALRAEQEEQAAAHAAQASQVYRGVYLDGCFMDWALRLRESCEKDALEAFLVLTDFSLKRQRWAEALEYSDRALEVNPLRQDVHMRNWRARLGLGRPEEVLQRHDRLKRQLDRDLGGVELQTDLLRLYQEARLAL